MKQWIFYGLIAALFISLRDFFSKGLFDRYGYIDFIIYANIILFIGTFIYIYITNYKFKKIPDKYDFLMMLLRIFVVYLIIEPSMYYSIKYCENPSYAKSIINLNTLFIFILSIIFLKSKINYLNLLGILLIIIGSYCIQ